MTVTVNKNKPGYVPTYTLCESEDQYLRRNFPVQGTEVQVKYNNVGPQRYRVNYYSTVHRKGLTAFMDFAITRSLYIALKRDSNGVLSHEIWDN